MSPIDDTFISSSLDQTVRLWDIRSQNARGLLNCPSSAIVAYEPTGTVFAVGFHNFNRINLYDVNNYDKDPFLHIEVQDPSLSRISFPPRIPFMTSLSFSNNGKYLLVGTSGDSHYLLDAYDGLMIAKLEGHRGLERGKNPQGQPLNPPNKGISGDELSWTPDSKFVVGGSHDGKIIIWDLSEESKLPPLQKGFTDLPVITPLTILDGHPGPSRCVKFNPRFAMMATGGADFALWLPDVSSSEYDDPKKALGKLGLL
jgi:COMPASS component SWD2